MAALRGGVLMTHLAGSPRCDLGRRYRHADTDMPIPTWTDCPPGWSGWCQPAPAQNGVLTSATGSHRMSIPPSCSTDGGRHTDTGGMDQLARSVSASTTRVLITNVDHNGPYDVDRTWAVRVPAGQEPHLSAGTGAALRPWAATARPYDGAAAVKVDLQTLTADNLAGNRPPARPVSNRAGGRPCGLLVNSDERLSRRSSPRMASRWGL